eukprot:EG_transcript_10864
MFTKWALLGAGAGLAASLRSVVRSDTVQELDAKSFTAGRVQLMEVIPVNHDTKLFRFKIPSDQEYRVPVSSCLACEMMHQGQLYRRYYTPITPIGTKGYIDLMIKLYPNGKMTPLMWNLKPGDKIRFQYWSKDQYKPNKYETIGMLAGGVGITPMLQLIREVITNPYDRTKIKLLFINKTENDIVLKEELDRLCLEYPNSLEVNYFLSRPSASWKGPKGSISPQVVSKFMPPPTSNCKLYVCGPHGFYHTLCGVGNSTISQWTQTNATYQPGIGILDSQMDEDSMLYRMGYSLRQVSVF